MTTKALVRTHAAILATLLMASPPARGGKLTCLGTDPSVADDATQLACARTLLIGSNLDCPCASFDGSPGKTHAAYLHCLKATYDASVFEASGGLRPQCKGTLLKQLRTATCGYPGNLKPVACVKKSLATEKVTCAIKPAAQCVDAAGAFTQVPCASSDCVDAADTNNDGVISATDSGACAVDAGPTDLSETLAGYRGDLPAIGAAVWKGGDLVAIGVSGVRKAGDSTPVTIHDEWHLGSDTKAMTATLIGLYVDRGKLRFEDTIESIFTGETIDPGYAKVTIEQLLQHRGGAPYPTPADLWAQMSADGSAPDARIKAVRTLLSRPPAQAPGTYLYSNDGYMIAGAALERVVGLSWEQIMQRDLFTPLQMGSCGFGAPGTAGRVDEPWGHQLLSDGQTLIPVSPGPQGDFPPALGPSDTVHCSLADWGKFLALPLAGARGEPTMVSPATMTRLQTPPVGGTYPDEGKYPFAYADGWILQSLPWTCGAMLTHSGSNTYWYATALLAPAKNVAVAVVTNQGDAGAAVRSVFRPLIEMYAR